MTDPIRELHRIIDARFAQLYRDVASIDVRGIVTEVHTDSRRLSARLDMADVATPGIIIPAGMSPVVGDDVLVRRRPDGFAILVAIIGR